jgi:excisionase family DNA binding protein
VYPRVESISALLADLDPAADLPASLRGRLLSSREVASLFRVSSRTVTSWAADGRLPSVRTPGGHHRFPVQAVRELLLAGGFPGPGAASRAPVALRWPPPPAAHRNLDATRL